MIISNDSDNIYSTLTLANNATEYSGLTLPFIASCLFNFGELGYVKNNIVYKFDTLSTQESAEYVSKYQLVISVDVTTPKDQSGLFLLDGLIHNSSWNFNYSGQDKNIFFNSVDPELYQLPYILPYTALTTVCIGFALSPSVMMFQPKILKHCVGRIAKYTICQKDGGFTWVCRTDNTLPLILDLTANPIDKLATESSIGENEQYFGTDTNLPNIESVRIRISENISPDRPSFADRIIHSGFSNIDVIDDFIKEGISYDQIYYITFDITDVFGSKNTCTHQLIFIRKQHEDKYENIYCLTTDTIRQIGGEDRVLLCRLYTPTYNTEAEFKQRLTIHKITNFVEGHVSITIDVSAFACFNPSIKIESISDTRSIVIIKYHSKIKTGDTSLKLIYLNSTTMTIISEHDIENGDEYYSKMEPETLNNPTNSHPVDFYCSIIPLTSENILCFFRGENRNKGFKISIISDVLTINTTNNFVFSGTDISHVLYKLIDSTSLAFVGIRNCNLLTGTCNIDPVISTVALTNVRIVTIDTQVSKYFYNHSFQFLNTVSDNKISVICAYLKDVGKGLFTPFVVKCILDIVGPTNHVIGPILELPNENKTSFFNMKVVNAYNSMEPIRIIYYKLDGTNLYDSGLYYYALNLVPDGTSFELDHEYELNSIRSTNGITTDLFIEDYALVSSTGDVVCIDNYIKRTCYPTFNNH